MPSRETSRGTPAVPRGRDAAAERLEAAAVDRHVGQRLRERRIQAGLSLEQLAAALDVTAQQAWKYETGRNGIPAGRLREVARVLGVPLAWLFEGLPGPRYVAMLPTRPRMLLDIMRAAELIPEERLAALCEAARALARGGTSASRPSGRDPATGA